MYNLHSSYSMKLDQADNFITYQDLLKIKSQYCRLSSYTKLNGVQINTID